MLWHWLSYGGAALGMAGAAINAFGARATWPVWLASNVALLVYTAHIHEWGLWAMNAFYLCTTVVGLVRARSMK